MDQLNENSKTSNLFRLLQNSNQFEENAKATIKKNTFSRAGVGQQKIHQRVQLHVRANSDYVFGCRPNEGNDTAYEGNDTESQQSISLNHGLLNASFFIISILALSSCILFRSNRILQAIFLRTSSYKGAKTAKNGRIPFYEGAIFKQICLYFSKASTDLSFLGYRFCYSEQPTHPWINFPRIYLYEEDGPFHINFIISPELIYPTILLISSLGSCFKFPFTSASLSATREKEEKPKVPDLANPKVPARAYLKVPTWAIASQLQTSLKVPAWAIQRVASIQRNNMNRETIQSLSTTNNKPCQVSYLEDKLSSSDTSSCLFHHYFLHAVPSSFKSPFYCRIRKNQSNTPRLNSSNFNSLLSSKCQ